MGDESWREYEDEPTGHPMSRIRLVVTKDGSGGAALHPGWGFKGCRLGKTRERVVMERAKQIIIVGRIRRESQVVGVRRADGILICRGSKCLAVGELLSGGPLHMAGGCEARHNWLGLPCSSGGKKKLVSQKPRRREGKRPDRPTTRNQVRV